MPVSECSICLQAESSRKSTRSNTEKWILCDCCCKWFHASCGGFCQSEYTKICKDKLWLKCVVCCMQQLLCSESIEDSSALIESVICVANKRISEYEVRKVNGKAKKKKKKSNKGKVVACVDAISSGVSHGSEQIHCCVDSQHTVSQQSDASENQGSFDCTNCSEVNECSVIGSDIAEKCDTVALDDCKKHFSDSVDNTDSVVISQYSDIDKILVIDNIENAVDFSSSKRILKGVNLYCSGIEIDFAYALAKGGVAIHTQSKEDRDRLIEVLPAESFGGGVKHPPLGHVHHTAFIKNIDTSVNAVKITQLFRDKGIELSFIRRLTSRFTGRLIQVVKVKCSEDVFDKLLTMKLVINNKTCVIEKECLVKVIRCYHCQHFGHIARNCKNAVKCEFCAESHHTNETCVHDIQCANCNGHHPSSSAQCPAYRKRYEIITAQHSEYPYFSSSVETCSTEVKH